MPLATDGARLAAIGQRHGVKVPPLPARELRGYLKGFVDLVFRHDERFYLVDYKSNWLGSASEDYAQDALQQAMAREGYHLQVLLYTVALRRWLVRRIPDFDYERHMGGACYLFLRGMGPEYRQPDGVPCGVYATRPARALIEALDEALGQSADQACRPA